MILCTLFILFFSLSFVNSNGSSNKIDKKVYDALNNQKGDLVRVIVKVNDGLNLESKKTIRKMAIASINNSRVKREYSSFNGFSAILSLSEIQKLSDEVNVEQIYLDAPVHALLQQSAPLINATQTWPIQINGVNLTGKGQTVCIIDTGVNYSHADLGGCQLRNLSLGGTNISYVLQSAHNYADNFDYTWKINYTGYSKISAHFRNLSLEYQGQDLGYDTMDRVIIYDSNKTEIASYHGVNGTIPGFWTPYSIGDTIYVRLVSDAYVNSYGFYIDQIRNGESNLDYNWSACPKVIYGWNFVNNTGDPMDDYNHGTHVAGIVAANGAIRGIAPQANIVAAKALDSSGNGWNSDIIYAIEFCTNISEKYNISVISMSLGDGVDYTTYCDASDTLTSSAINTATAKNISVVVASGNEFHYNGISAPACMQNAIPVGATDKSDNFAAYSNRNWMVQLFAPGSSINSTWITGGYSQDTGTSMAAPHVAGAFAIINEYLKLKGQTRTPQQIESILNSTGKNLYDSSSAQNYSRINIYAAIASLDETPAIDFISPTENTASLINRNNILINLSSSSLAIKNMTIRLFNSTQKLINSSTSFTSSLFFNFANLSSGTYYFNATIYTTFGNYNITETRNVTIDTIYPTFFNDSISGPLTRYTNFNLNITFLDNLGLNTAWLESNHTGNFLNYSYGLNGPNQTFSVSFNITSSARYFSYRWIFNDSAGNINLTFPWQNVNIVNTPPINQVIANQSWVMNSNFSLNLSQYFSDIDGNELNYTNISANNVTIIINQITKIANFIPNVNWNGTSYVEFIANDSFNTTFSNNITIYVFKPNIFFNSSIFDGALTTNFSNLTSFVNVSVIIEKNNTGMINFSRVDLSNQTIDLSYVVISFNHIEINSSALPGFNKSALLTLLNLSFTSPMILRDGNNCTSCSRLDYTNGTLLFNVTSFSVYTTREDPRCGDSLCESAYSETCSSCASDCGACPPSGGSSGGGGGGISVKSVNKTNNQTNFTLNASKVNNLTNVTKNETIKTGENKNSSPISNRAQFLKIASGFIGILLVLGIILSIIIRFFKSKQSGQEPIEKDTSKKKKR